MAETSEVKQYFKNCFDKKLLIQKAIIAGAALVLVLAFSLSFYFWLKDKQGVVGNTNPFWYLEISWNDKIGFSIDISTPGIFALQSVMFVLLLAIFLLLTHDKITSSFVALAMFGGLFNLIQRASCPIDHYVNGCPAVLDYFEFGFWPNFPIFNWPDTFVVIGIFGFVISYITLLIMQAVKEKNGKR